MSITIDFILLFILVVIPGLLFKRFYFFGEFSKQFNSKETVYKSIFYSIIPGVLIQVLAFWLYLIIRTPSFGNEDIICIFNELFSGQNTYSDVTVEFLRNGFHLFFLHELGVFILAISLGILFSRIIRAFKLDVKHKILRFKNQWYYVFSGEIRSFKKFKIIPSILGETNGQQNKYKYYPPYADILVEGGTNGTSLYTGYVIDYDLEYENLNDLDKIYLIGANRYRPLRSGENTEGLEVKGSRVKVPIEGDVFILQANKVLNMNLTFIPSPEIEKTKSKLWKIVRAGIYYLGVILNLFILIYLIGLNSFLFKDLIPSITTYASDFNWIGRIFMALIVIQTVTLFMPPTISKTEENLEEEDVNKENKSSEIEPNSQKDEFINDKDSEQIEELYEYSWEDFGLKVAGLSILVVIYYFVMY